jgi:enoyl-CoA hydratase/carnithine racemase
MHYVTTVHSTGVSTSLCLRCDGYRSLSSSSVPLLRCVSSYSISPLFTNGIVHHHHHHHQRHKKRMILHPKSNHDVRNGRCRSLLRCNIQWRRYSNHTTMNDTFDATRFTDESSLVRFQIDDIVTTPCLESIIRQKQLQEKPSQRTENDNVNNNNDSDSYDTILENMEGKIGTITINSPQTYNALTMEIGIEFQALCQRLAYELQYQATFATKPTTTTPSSQPQESSQTQNKTKYSTMIANRHDHESYHHHHDINESVCTLSSLNAQHVQVLILKGAGPAFSAGGNLPWLHSLHQDQSVIQNYDTMIQFYQYYASSIRMIPIPIIAAMNGPAMGAGACLALLCDLRTGCQSTTKLGMHFTKLGIHSGLGGAYLLQYVISSATLVNEILLLGKILNGTECYQYHVINQIHDSDALIPAYEMAYDMISNHHPVAVRMLLQTLRLSHHQGLNQALERDAMCQSICYHQKDWGEGLHAIAQKRSPSFVNYRDYYNNNHTTNQDGNSENNKNRNKN